jgi:hypothetical protein
MYIWDYYDSFDETMLLDVLDIIYITETLCVVYMCSLS